MKVFKKVLPVLFIIVLFLNLFVLNVDATTYNLTGFYGNSWGGGFGTNSSGNGTMSAQSSGASFHLYGINLSVFNVNGVSYLNALIYNTSGSDNYNGCYFYIGNNQLVGVVMVYNKNILNVNLLNAVIEVKGTFNDSAYGNTYIGSFYLKYKYITNGTISVLGTSDAPSFSLVYNNDYNYASNQATFTMQPSNFTFQYFSFLNTDLSNTGALGGFHLLNYSVSGNTLNITFDNTYINVANPHYVVFKAVGLDLYNNKFELSGNVSFNLNSSNNQYNGMKFRVYYSPEISPCSSGVALGYFFFAVDSGDGKGYKDVDGSKYTLVVGVKQVNGNPDVFNVDLEQYDVYSKAYAIRWNNPDNEPVDTYHFIINYLGLTFEGDFDPCKNSWIDFDQTGNITNNQTYDWKDFLKQIRDVFVGLWNLILSIVNFFSALLLAILNVLYSLGVAIVSLLKIIFDFFASVSSIIFSRDTNYYSISTLVSIPDSISYGGKVIALPGLVGQFDNVLRYLHDNIILKYNAVWSLIAVIILIQRHVVKNKDMEDDNG